MAREQLPKFLIADDGGERGFVVHCHYPRFIVEFTEEEAIADFLDEGADQESQEKVDQLIQEAAEFYEQQFGGDEE